MRKRCSSELVQQEGIKVPTPCKTVIRPLDAITVTINPVKTVLTLMLLWFKLLLLLVVVLGIA